MAEDPSNKREVLLRIGREIRERREKLGLSLAQVQEATKIRLKYLQAVEEGNDDIGLGLAYYRAFLKTYATFLGMDGVALSSLYARISGQEASERTVPVPVQKVKESSVKSARKPRQSGISFRKVALLFLGLIAVSGLAVMVFQARNSAVSRSRVPPATESSTPRESPESPSAEPAKPTENKPTITRKDPDSSTTVFSVLPAPINVMFLVMPEQNSNCWIRAECDGKVVDERTLRPGEKLEYVAESEIKVRIGKPWVVKMTVNGVDLGTAGPVGPVKDVIFRIGTTQ